MELDFPDMTSINDIGSTPLPDILLQILVTISLTFNVSQVEMQWCN